MNIALFPSAFHPHYGGVEELTRQLAHQLVARGHRVIVITNRWPRSLPAYEEHEGIPLYRIPMRVPEGGIKARVSYALTHRQIVARLGGILRRHRVDVIHVHCVSSNGMYARIASEMLRVPLVVTAHGELTMDATQLFQRSALARHTLQSCLTAAKAITACSHQTLSELQGFHERPFGQPAQVIYSGIHVQDFEEAAPFHHRRPYLLGIGRHVRQKGFDVLLRAFAMTAAMGNAGFDLVLAGDGPEHEPLREMANALSVSERVHFTGRADRSAACSLFKGCSLFVLPSRHEPFGIVNLEAMAAGKAVVASQTGGVSEVVRDGVTGLLVPPEEPEALARAVMQLVRDESLCSRLGSAGKQAAASFDWPVITAQYVALYRGVCA